jgi:iron complex outermembrane receptor protein
MKQLLIAPLSLAVACALSKSAMAQSSPTQRELDAIIVTASPLKDGVEQLLAPADVLHGQTLDDALEGTLGETLERTAGVQPSYFGPAVSRPIIRGLEGARVAVLSGGLSNGDVSTVSVDHAVTVDPFLADQIEVIRGPGSLLYGSGAIAGVVNVVDGRIAHVWQEGLSGRAAVLGETAADTRAGVMRLDLGTGERLMLHADASYRSADAYELPDGALGDEKSLANSEYRTRAAALGGSFIDEELGHIGLALSTFRSKYGIPGESEDEDSQQNEPDLMGAFAVAKSADRYRAKGGESGVKLDLEQDRIALDSSLLNGFGPFTRTDIKLAHTQYQHSEIEPDGAIGTVFDNDESDLRIELPYMLAAGGALGLTWSDRDFSAVGEEAFVPPSRTRTTGAFLLQRLTADRLEFEAGTRFESVRLSALGQPSRRFEPLSFSGSARADLGLIKLGLNVDRAERALSSEELYANGPHAATRAFEIGDSSLDLERADQLELQVRFEGEHLHAHASAYRNRFDRFTYLSANGETEDELPVFLWTQADARFNGFEIGFEWQARETALGWLTVDGIWDRVRARLSDGVPLPRIAPQRFGLGVGLDAEQWRARLGLMRYSRQTQVSDFETPTEGFSDVDLEIAYRFEIAALDHELYLHADNLSDQVQRLHTSFLKSEAPLPGRSIEAGIRIFF